MARQRSISVKSLKLDLNNFRALPQASEIDEVRILYYSAPEWFEGLLFSIAKDGYSSLESIGVLEQNGKYIVLEGNRRVSIFKILLGIYSYEQLSLKMSKRAQDAIESITAQWKQENSKIPCIIFREYEESLLREIVRRTHGIDNKAARKTWESISKARESRDLQGNAEPELDLIEAILRRSARHSAEQEKSWLSNIKFSLFQEIAREISKRIKIPVEDLRDRYVAKDLRPHTIDVLEKLVVEIGMKRLKFNDIRREQGHFYTTLNLEEENTALGYQYIQSPAVATITGSTEHTAPPISDTATEVHTKPDSTEAPVSTSTSTTYAIPTKTKATKKDTSPMPGSVRHCGILISNLNVSNFPDSKDKLKILQKEMKLVNTDETPNALASLFRNILDLTFSEYCAKRNLNLSKNTLLDKIVAAHTHILNVAQDRKSLERDLTQPFAALTDQHSCISTAALNVIVHRKASVASPGDLRLGIHRVMPLLKAIGL